MQMIVNLLVFSLFFGAIALLVTPLWTNAARIMLALSGQGVAPINAGIAQSPVTPPRLRLVTNRDIPANAILPRPEFTKPVFERMSERLAA